jgi:hypothetical protein
MCFIPNLNLSLFLLATQAPTHPPFQVWGSHMIWCTMWYLRNNHLASTRSLTPRNYVKIGAHVDNKYIQTSPFFCYCIHLATEMRSPNWWQFLFLKCLYFMLCRIYFWGQFGVSVLLDPIWNIDNFQHCTKTFWAVFKLLQCPDMSPLKNS